MQQNYTLDIGYTYYAVGFTGFQSVVIETVTNESSSVVLATYLPTINAQVLGLVDTCALPKGIKPRKVEIELISNNTKYVFDIPFNSSSSILYASLITELDNIAIKSWVITGEKIPGYKVPLLLTKVP